ncbi:MAG: histidine phosphatase family protein [Crocinitomicaceae bacterium]|nr:histidine phosphatase family protein [Crocinitomicaceae bacterium]|tara:strand:- start:5224 stop:5772 length:549 start_codon:yes stop_codon:yes gene_type:complete
MTKILIYRTTRFASICASLMLLAVAFPCTMTAQDSDGLFTIYLVRHAEKQTDSNDPPLTECGVERSASFSALFESVTLEAVYSTDYKRTQSTALPTATDQGLSIQSYEPDALGEIAEELIRNGQDALVVGHSNTTAVLAGMLVGEELGSFDESIYNRVYQVVVSKADRRLHLLHTSFDCSGR